MKRQRIVNRLGLTAWQRRRLERQLHETTDARIYRRTLAVLEYNRGRSVRDIGSSLAMSARSVYNWIDAYAKCHDPGALHDDARPGRPSLWTEERQALLTTLLNTVPDQLGLPAVNWTVPLLQEQIEQATGQKLSAETIRRQLRRERMVWKRPRYILDPDPERYKKTQDSQKPSLVEPGYGSSDRGRNRSAVIPTLAGGLGAGG